jgi:hypothetical protein
MFAIFMDKKDLPSIYRKWENKNGKIFSEGISVSYRVCCLNSRCSLKESAPSLRSFSFSGT